MPLSKAKKGEYNKDFYRRKKLGILRENQIPKPTIPEPPLYNPSVHKAGDIVRVYRGKKLLTTRIPYLDAGGSEVPDYW